MAFAQRASLSFIDTSAKDDRNVEKTFAELVTRIFRKIISNDRINRADEHASTPIHSQARMSRSSGETEPAHYMLKIECFSLLSAAGTFVFESDIFDAGGYKWRLELYPNGFEEEDALGYISVYVAICDTESLPKGWEVWIDPKFFVYDHVRENYIIFQAEVFVAPKYVQKDQCLSMIKPPVITSTFSWTIHNFSAVTEKVLSSDYFKVGKVKWELHLYPKGYNIDEKDTHLSIFLQVHDHELLPDGCRVYAKYEIRLKNQIAFSDKVTRHERWFSADDSWGTSRFILLSELHDMEKGFLLNDVLTVEAEFSFVGMLKDFH